MVFCISDEVDISDNTPQKDVDTYMIGMSSMNSEF